MFNTFNQSRHNRNQRRPMRNATWTVTQVGKAKADSFAGNGIRWEVVANLAENGPSSVQEIANGLGENPARIEKVLRNLAGLGYVKPTANEA